MTTPILLLTALCLAAIVFQQASCDHEAIGKCKDNADSCVLIDKNDLADLQRQAELGKAVGRYQIHREGADTWRLDTATGQTCLLLAPEWDWKKPDIAAQGCDFTK